MQNGAQVTHGELTALGKVGYASDREVQCSECHNYHLMRDDDHLITIKRNRLSHMPQNRYRHPQDRVA